MTRNYPTVRLVKRVAADFPFSAEDRAKVAEPGEHRAYMNHYGAVSVLTPPGTRLGVKPAEFAWVHGKPDGWHAGTTCNVAANLAIVTETNRHRVSRVGPGMGIEPCALAAGHEGPHRARRCCWTPSPDDKDTLCPICRSSGYLAPVRKMAWRDFQAFAQGWEPLYGAADGEHLWDDPQAGLEDVHGPEVSGPVSLHVYERRELDDSYIRRAARDLLEWWSERFSEDFGGDDGQGEDGGEQADAEAFVRACAARAKPWQCEFTGIAVMFDEADLAAFGVRVVQPEAPEPA
jgi:hypothetical protein